MHAMPIGMPLAAVMAAWRDTSPEEYELYRKGFEALRLYGSEEPEMTQAEFARVAQREDLIPLGVLDTTIEQPITRQYGIVDGIGIVQIEIQHTGVYVPQHSHEYDHITLIPVGGLRVWKNGVLDKDYFAPAMITIPAHVKHTFMSLKPTVFCCIHNVSRTGHVEIHERHEFTVHGTLHPDDEVI